MGSIETYRHSGRMGPLAIPCALGAGLAAAGALAWLYQALLDGIPSIYLSVLVTAGYGGVVGLAIGYAYRVGKGRNAVAAFAIAGVSGLVGDALSFHFAYERVMARVAGETRDLVFAEHGEVDVDTLDAPEEKKRIIRAIMGGEGAADAVKQIVPFGRFLRLRAEEGTSVSGFGKGLPVRGWLIYLVWLIEAAAICVVAAGAQWLVWQRPFCEQCNRWTDTRPLGSIACIDFRALSDAVRAGDLATLLRPPIKERGSKSVDYTVHGCPHCDLRYVSVSLEWTGRSKRGRPEKRSQLVIEHAAVTRAQAEEIEARVAG